MTLLRKKKILNQDSCKISLWFLKIIIKFLLPRISIFSINKDSTVTWATTNIQQNILKNHVNQGMKRMNLTE